MNYIEINLIKRNNKLILYIMAALLCTFGVISFAAELVKDGFSWWTTIIGSLFVFGAFLIGSRLYVYFTSHQVKLIAESDGKTMVFYCKNDSGKVFNKSESINLNKMGRFYIVKKRTRYLMDNYAFAYEGKGAKTSLFKEEIEAFPSLFEATENDRHKIMEFVKNAAPEVALGYENMWQKIKTNK
ncbi:hypothetical protein EZL74_03235 [Flavobacterium silvisoli]|uniref:Uncharacterized protein n=1 Tax=Flavobacterium silvisoli TaxID=2529433 RepID=A0A4Q9Z397_9FLAO|nr:hypothetical protein [Flavobacterium silvisoli]TBX70700.1 hypothetical protein EZL74_03235 [Flavobacterium silvisoli]